MENQTMNEESETKEVVKQPEGMVVPGNPEEWRGIIDSVDKVVNGGTKVHAEAQVKIHEANLKDRRHKRYFDYAIVVGVLTFIMIMVYSLIIDDKNPELGFEILKIGVVLVIGFIGGAGWHSRNEKKQ